MPPNSEYEPVKSTIGVQDAFREGPKGSLEKWFEIKKAGDNAEGLWRIHDKLYDFDNFLKTHPGGKFWLEVTKGTDITEAFESHHISLKAENMLQKFYVRDAKGPSPSPYQFKEDGFYKTLKRAVREELKNMPDGLHKKTDLIMDCLFAATILTGILANVFWSYTLGIISGFLCGMSIIAGHNYSHQRDNFRMYYLDVLMSASSEFRIAHVLSHHLYTNTVADVQTYFFEPMLVYFPQKKSWVQKYATILYAPLLIWPTSFPMLTFLKWFIVIFGSPKDTQNIKPGKEVLLPLIFPVAMYLSADQSIFATFCMWMIVEFIGGFAFGSIAYTMGHFHPDIFLDGDKPRPKEDLDWGICQLDAVGDRYEVTGNRFIVLVAFGDHAGHHLFPTLDVGVVEYLNPTIERVMKQFNLRVRMMSQTKMYFSYLQRVALEKPNPNPPDLHRDLH